MNGHTLRRSFIAFHLTLGIVVALESLITVLHASGNGGAVRHSSAPLAWFAGAEVVAALLFLLPATMKVGAWSLLLIFFFALAFHGLHGELQLTLLVYGVGVILVMAHGSAFGHGRPRQSATI